MVFIVGRTRGGSKTQAKIKKASTAAEKAREAKKKHKEHCEYIIQRAKPYGRGKFKTKGAYGALVSLFFKLYMKHELPSDKAWNATVAKVCDLLTIERRLVIKAAVPFRFNKNASMPVDRARWRASTLPGSNVLKKEHIDWIEKTIDAHLNDKNFTRYPDPSISIGLVHQIWDSH